MVERPAGLPTEAPAPLPPEARAAAARLLSQTAPGCYLPPAACEQLLALYGIPAAKSFFAAQEADLDSLGLAWPVAAKLDHPDVIHKSDVGGVRLGVRSTDELRSLFRQWREQFPGMPSEKLAGLIAAAIVADTVMTWGVCRKAAKLGAKVVTLSGPDGYVYDPDGVTTQEKFDFMAEMRASGYDRVEDYAERFGVEFYPGKKPWEVPADIAMKLICPPYCRISSGRWFERTPPCQTSIPISIIYGTSVAA